MRIKFYTLTLIAVLLLIGLVSCDNGKDPLEAGLDDSDVISEVSDDDQKIEGGQSFTEFPANVQLWPMISTGQSDCYSGDGKIPCPEVGEPFFGQDGSYQYGVRSYVDNGDGTTTDLATNLTWQQGFKKNVNWYEANNYCDILSLNGLKWRIPQTHELKSIVDYGAADPAIDTAAFPEIESGELSVWFWAAKNAGFNDIGSGLEASWMINFYDGFVEYTSRSKVYNVRCVKRH